MRRRFELLQEIISDEKIPKKLRTDILMTEYEKGYVSRDYTEAILWLYYLIPIEIAYEDYRQSTLK